MRFCREGGIVPEALALGALAGLRGLAGHGAASTTTAALLRSLWGADAPEADIVEMAAFVDAARPALERIVQAAGGSA